MKNRPLGRTGIQVSEICLGAMNFGNPRFGVGEKESVEVMHAYLDRGGNFIDTADAYTGGESERLVGKALAGRRDAVVVATKGFFPVVVNVGEPPAHVNAFGCSRRHLTRALEDSLRRLDTDYVDLYQVHCWDPQTPIEETLQTLDGFVRSGKVRYLGLSNYTAWQIAESMQLQRAQGLAPFVSAQMQWSLICRDIEHDVVPVCERYGLGLLPWSPLGQGVLTGKYQAGSDQGAQGTRFAGPPPTPAAAAWRKRFLHENAHTVAEAVGRTAESLKQPRAAVAIAWLLQRHEVSSVIIGPKTVAQLDDNLAGSGLDLGATARELDSVSELPMPYPEWFVATSPRAKR